MLQALTHTPWGQQAILGEELPTSGWHSSQAGPWQWPPPLQHSASYLTRSVSFLAKLSLHLVWLTHRLVLERVDHTKQGDLIGKGPPSEGESELIEWISCVWDFKVLSQLQGFPAKYGGKQDSQTGANEVWTNISAGDKSCFFHPFLAASPPTDHSLKWPLVPGCYLASW